MVRYRIEKHNAPPMEFATREDAQSFIDRWEATVTVEPLRFGWVIVEVTY